ncbi:hypothetical protein SAMN05216259_102438 [Actinacidiphila guanduensis]|uniref:Uncharacterized protein n=1 Tax=Actinacidiphila guanduensis TaxID=310781 RepID=A0A1G9Y8L6_9ACTN|nr:hypothetical protein SAMN05216259_102438 [Actinacidiphila guanduensis]
MSHGICAVTAPIQNGGAQHATSRGREANSCE